MIVTVERKRTMRAPVQRVVAALNDPANLRVLMPRIEQVEVLAHGEGRERLALHMRFSRLGSLRVEGEARALADGTRFVAVQPMEIDSRFRAQQRGEGSEVIARLSVELPRRLAPFARWIPQRVIEERVARELDSALDALAALLVTEG